MRRDVQEIFRNTPHGKQVMMFSATLSKDIRPVCKKFMQDVNINLSILLVVVVVLLLSPIPIVVLLVLKMSQTVKVNMNTDRPKTSNNFLIHAAWKKNPLFELKLYGVIEI